jgi:hypothetical protein
VLEELFPQRAQPQGRGANAGCRRRGKHRAPFRG